MQIKLQWAINSHQSEWPSPKKPTSNKYSWCGGKVALLHCWWECKLVQPLWWIVWRFLKKLKIELPYDPAIILLGIYPEKNTFLNDTCTQMFIAVLFTVAKTWKQPKCIWMKGVYVHVHERWMAKDVVHIYAIEYYWAIKRMK